MHYDPNKQGPDVGGWWNYPNASDERPVTGLPGVGETSANIADQIGNEAAWQIPVGSYVDQASHYGVLDASGGVSEWLEDWVFPDDPDERFFDGHSSDDPFYGIFDKDHLAIPGGSRTPDGSPNDLGVRIASAVPAPGVGVMILACGGFISTRRRR